MAKLGGMTANELRIGNLVIAKDTPLESIVKVRAQHIAEAEEHNPSWFLHPIPLTPEILEKAGFKYDTVCYYRNGVHIGSFKDGLYFTCSPISKDSVEIKYLHQLQNLYFALAGEELEINL